jgi:hypothetical protein
MKRLYFIPIYLLFILFSWQACNQKIFHANTMKNADFEEFKTFAFLPNPDTTEYEIYDSEIIHYRSMVAVKEELNNRGYSMDTANPDLLVVVRPLFKNISENPYNNWPPNFGGQGHMMYYRGLTTIPNINGSNYPEIEYARGTVMVDIIKTGNFQLIYRGWSEQVINANPLPNELDNYIARLLQKLPNPT